MRRVVLLLVVLLPALVSAAVITLAWDPSDVALGYNLYYGSASGAYTNEISVGNNTSITVSNLVPGVTYFFAATDYDSSGIESEFSTEVSYNVPSGQVPPPVVLLNAQIGGGIIVTSSVPVSP